MNKIAIGIVGEYSDTFLHNSLLFEEDELDPLGIRLRNNIDLFCFSFSEIPELFTSLCKTSIYCDKHPDEIIPNFKNTHISMKTIGIYQYSYKICQHLIEIIGKGSYDTIYLTTFRHIILSLAGTEKLAYSSFLEWNCAPALLSVEVVSSSQIAWHNIIQSVYDLPESIRTLFLQIYFNNKVVDYKNFQSNRLEKPSDLVFIIPSVVTTTTQKLDCSEYRSVFSPTERIQQTLSQIKSLNTIVDQKYSRQIYVCEGSPIDLHFLSMFVNTPGLTQVVLFFTDKQGNMYANDHPNKSIYEVYVMQNMITKIDSKWYFKFGARYYLSPMFSIDKFTKSLPVIKKIDGQVTFTGRPICQSVIYSFPATHRVLFHDMYANMIGVFNASDELTAIENELYNHLALQDIEWIETLNVIGYDALFAKLNYI
jgi:hypothetical protein